MSIFKKRGGHISATSIPMTEAEAALAQSDFNIEKITEIQNKFAGGAVLLVPGRIFIREGLLWKVCRKGIKKRQFFLFNDILVYGSVVASRYSNQHSLALDKMSVSSECFYQPRVQSDFDADADSLDQQLDPSNAFQISHADKSFHVFASSTADKANWLANLNKHISRAAQLVADSPQQMMTRPVWVPDAVAKECMVCHTKFSTFVRKHHCRRCGRVVCSACSPHHVSLSAIDSSVASHTPHGEQGKLERVCKECFKEMTAQHNRSNSQSRGSKVAQSPSQDTFSFSTSLGSPVRKVPEQDSSDTEDSDDSSDEKSTIDDHSHTSPSLVQKGAADSNPGSSSELAGQKETVVVAPPTDVTNVEEPKKFDDTTSDVQPTPPPRKKKLEKLLKKQLEANERVNETEEKNEDAVQELSECVAEGVEKEKEIKKTRRKNKHSKPVGAQGNQETTQDTTQPEQSNLKAESEEEDMTSNQTELSETIKDSRTEDPDREMSNVAAAAEGSNKEANEKASEAEQDQSPSTPKKARGRRKKFKATADTS